MMEQYAGVMTQALTTLVPAGFHRLVLSGKFFAESCMFTFYVQQQPGQPFVKYTELMREGVFSRKEMADAFWRLQDAAKRARQAMAQPFTAFTFVVNREGRFLIDYEYGPQTMEISPVWKRRYLSE